MDNGIIYTAENLDIVIQFVSKIKDEFSLLFKKHKLEGHCFVAFDERANCIYIRAGVGQREYVYGFELIKLFHYQGHVDDFITMTFNTIIERLGIFKVFNEI